MAWPRQGATSHLPHRPSVPVRSRAPSVPVRSRV